MLFDLRDNGQCDILIVCCEVNIDTTCELLSCQLMSGQLMKLYDGSNALSWGCLNLKVSRIVIRNFTSRKVFNFFIITENKIVLYMSYLTLIFVDLFSFFLTFILLLLLYFVW